RGRPGAIRYEAEPDAPALPPVSEDGNRKDDGRRQSQLADVDMPEDRRSLEGGGRAGVCATLIPGDGRVQSEREIVDGGRVRRVGDEEERIGAGARQDQEAIVQEDDLRFLQGGRLCCVERLLQSVPGGLQVRRRRRERSR